MDEYPRIRLPTQSRIFTPATPTGLRLALEDECANCSAENASGSDLSSNLSFLTDDLKTKLQQQRDESDQFIRVQAERLRLSLSEKNQRHTTSLLTLAGESVSRHLRDKNMEMEKENLRNRVLEERVNQLKLEAHMWKIKARNDEAMVATLKRDLQQAVAQSRELNKEGPGDGEADDAGSAHLDPNAEVHHVEPLGRDKTTCKVCQRNTVSILLLPCRHLCCRDCEAIIVACPLCFTMKEASVEVYMS